MTLTEQIRSMGREELPSTLYTDRAMVLVWGDEDPEARALCDEVLKRASALSSFSYAAGELETALRGLTENTPNREVRIFWVWKAARPCLPGHLTALMRTNGNVTVDLVRLNCPGERETVPAPGEGVRREWRLRGGRAEEALTVLLAVEAAPGLSLLPLGSTVAELEVTAHNAVEQDLARQLRDLLEELLAQQTCKDEEKTLAERFRLPADRRAELLSALPGLEDLPMVGYDELVRRLGLPTASQGLLRRLLRRLLRGGQRQDASTSIGSAMDILFGRQDGKPMARWLLDREREAVKTLCGDQMKSLELQQRCFRLPLCFLLDRAGGLAAARQRAAAGEAQEAAEKWEHSLRENFCPANASPSALTKGLGPSVDAWKAWRRWTVETVWWEQVKELLEDSQLRARAEGQRQLFLDAARELDRSWAVKPKPRSALGTMDWSAESVDSLLYGLQGNGEFDRGALRQLIQDAVEKTENAVHGMQTRRCLLLWDKSSVEELENICGDLLERRGEELVARSNTADLRVVPVAGLGARVFWEVRVRVCNEGG